MGTSRVVVSRLLKHLENEGKVLLYRNELMIMTEIQVNINLNYTLKANNIRSSICGKLLPQISTSLEIWSTPF